MVNVVGIGSIQERWCVSIQSQESQEESWAWRGRGWRGKRLKVSAAHDVTQPRNTTSPGNRNWNCGVTVIININKLCDLVFLRFVHFGRLLGRGGRWWWGGGWRVKGSCAFCGVTTDISLTCHRDASYWQRARAKQRLRYHHTDLKWADVHTCVVTLWMLCITKTCALRFHFTDINAVVGAMTVQWLK